MKINGSEVWNLWMRFLSKFFQIPIGPGMVDEKPLRKSPCELSLRRRKGRRIPNFLDQTSLFFLVKLFFFLSACCQENQAPGVALRLVTEKYVLRTPSFAICLQNTVWPINGSDYQPAQKLLIYPLNDIIETSLTNYCLSRLIWLGCEIYIKSKIGSSLFVQKKPCIFFIYTKNLTSGRKNTQFLLRFIKSKFSVKL